MWAPNINRLLRCEWASEWALACEWALATESGSE